ncbi:hypothetical protein MKK68_28105 [Methylobacterium sp. E-016]|uniref:hypothetical protein n=1 Tax=Methylobacterium sp. E-016 TaxID=2836556 RepID=UPI001FBB851F|nr:hypothetical protein [Methylobacterium sp. E-016]MCJ2079449.1 hypothetical protein [Methylobacterium sp. E-016]
MKPMAAPSSSRRTISSPFAQKRVPSRFWCHRSSLARPSMQLRDHPPHDFWLDGQVRRTLIAPKGCLHIADLNGTPRALLREPVDSLHLELPRAALDDLAEEVGVSIGVEKGPGIGVQKGPTGGMVSIDR